MVMRLLTDCYVYYIGLNKFVSGFKSRMLSKSDFAEVSNALYKSISNNIINNDGGIYIDNLGYFCHPMRPERKLSRGFKGSGIRRMMTNGYKINHACIDFSKPDQFYHIGVDFIKPLILECKKKVRSGFFYKFFFAEADSYASLIEKPVVKYKNGIRSIKNKNE